MITYDKLKIFQECNGDGDYWVRTSRSSQNNQFSYKDWSLIEQLISDLKLINKGLAAASYVESIEKSIKGNCSDESTITKLKELSMEM